MTQSSRSPYNRISAKLLSESLKRAVIELLEAEFPTLDFTTNFDADCFVTIHPAWSDFGRVGILEYQGQLIVNWGRFTQSHIDSYDEDVSGAFTAV